MGEVVILGVLEIVTMTAMKSIEKSICVHLRSSAVPKPLAGITR